MSNLTRSHSDDLLDDPLDIPPPTDDLKPTFFIGVAGGSASGKTEVCNYIMEKLKQKHKHLNRKVAMIQLTDFYRVLTPEEQKLAQEGEFNFDHPDAFDWKLLEQVLQDILHGKRTTIPKFDYISKVRLPEPGLIIDFHPDVVLVEGILVLYKKRIREILSMKIFVDVDPDARLSRTVMRDTTGENGRQVKSLEFVLNQWIKFVKPAFEDFILPSKKTADVIIPRGHGNEIALSLLVQHIDDLLLANSTVSPSSLQPPTFSVKTSLSPANPHSLSPNPSPDDSNGKPRRRKESGSVVGTPISPKMQPNMDSLLLNEEESYYKPVPN
ncbi:uridine kinase family-domain-containing protein [Paraphysoderma sedebokerense]|nr:uridine kinase family-domain-containing protein [Paraphysoderma sedebokerense]